MRRSYNNFNNLSFEIGTRITSFVQYLIYDTPTECFNYYSIITPCHFRDQIHLSLSNYICERNNEI